MSVDDYLKRMNVPLNFWDVQLDCIKEPQKRVIIKYLTDFKKFLKKGYGLLLWSGYGSGKSAAAAVILRDGVALNGKTGLWIFADDIPTYIIEKTRFDEHETFYDRLLSVDLLVIDELILRKRDRFADTSVEMVFRRRLAARKSTIFTTNLSPEVIKEEYPALENALRESVYPVKFFGQFRDNKAALLKEELKGGAPDA